ncbi:HpcH/HpaI aldolase/citrate lyase family protein [Streptomyces sp. NPDC060209]|uniref:HpcH/HpaI aldolase/citrate lyase family protein n=1 Tax=Streptomyces sp. NPDC060209 TaxID=3347073 RepID=UPI003653BEA5
MTWTPQPAWLFCPADRPDRYVKALQRSDIVVLDLEDAVAPGRKRAARDAVEVLINEGVYDMERTVLRINAASSPEHAEDVTLLDRAGVGRVMLAKTERLADLDHLGDRNVIALIETPLGVERCEALADANPVAGLMWGADDLVAGLGGTSSRRPDGGYRDVGRYARSRVLIAAKARHLLAIDAVHMDIDDIEGLRAECEDAAAVGFDATVAIHPSQVEVIRRAYAPSPEQADWAVRLFAAVGQERGVATFEGRMVDGPVYAQAERILRWAAASAQGFDE